MDIILLFISFAIAQNIVLTKFLGNCPFLGVSKKTSSAIAMGGAVTVVITISSLVSKLLFDLLLVPMEVEYLNTIVFILVIASLVQLLELIIKKYLPPLYDAFGIYLPLITTNCAVLGTALLVATNTDGVAAYSWIDATIVAFGTGAGFAIVIALFSAIREKLDDAPVPRAFKGVPIALITAGIMAIIFTNAFGVIVGLPK